MCGRKPGELGEVSSDSSKAYRELGWKAEKSLEDMCRYYFYHNVLKKDEIPTFPAVSILYDVENYYYFKVSQYLLFI